MTTASTAAIDETAWLAFATRHHPAMVKVAEAFLGDVTAAERLALDVWRDTSAADLLAGPSTDAGRRLVSAVIERARQAVDDELQEGTARPPFAPERFLGDDHDRWPGHWAQPPRPIDAEAWGSPTGRMAAVEAFGDLATSERVVLALHDVAGWTTQEISDRLALDVTSCRRLLANARWSVASRLDAAIRAEA